MKLLALVWMALALMVRQMLPEQLLLALLEQRLVLLLAQLRLPSHPPSSMVAWPSSTSPC